jgi:hypothetical protein
VNPVRLALTAAASAFGSAFRLARTVEDTLGMAYILTDLGAAHATLGSAENAYPLLYEAANLAEQSNNAHVQGRARQVLEELTRRTIASGV